ncbi:hypothetical protein BDN72DRAFT_901361 [Pluteus cervinus]|uniref:Uncharacterized protein n=1 Tax=Pluteus cervinus TaxID=181527 RepID=A0ACD3AGF2_9AGAR|nr:hypothetical protein BDN72DRAFT_901361 [Pluteus cervinus]
MAPHAWFNYLYFTSRLAPIFLLASAYLPWFMMQTTSSCDVLVTAHTASMLFLQLVPHVFLIYRCWVFVEMHPALRCFPAVFRSIVLCLQVLATIFAHKLFTSAGNPLEGEFGCFGDPNGRARVRAIVYTIVSYPRHVPSLLATSLYRVNKVMGSSTDLIGGLIVVWYRFVNPHRPDKSRLRGLFIQQTLISVGFILVVTTFITGFYASDITELRGVGLIFLVTVPNVLVCRCVLNLRESASSRHTVEELSRIVNDDLTQNADVNPPIAV